MNPFRKLETRAPDGVVEAAPMEFTVLTLEKFEGKKKVSEVWDYLKKRYRPGQLAGKDALEWILDEKNKDHPEAQKLNYGNIHFFGATNNGTVPYVHRDEKFYRHERNVDDTWDVTFQVLIRNESKRSNPA